MREYGLGATSVEKKTARFGISIPIILGGMGLTDRKSGTNYSRADTMFHRYRVESQSLQGHAIHEGIMELNLVEPAVWSKLAQELQTHYEGDWEREVVHVGGFSRIRIWIHPARLQPSAAPTDLQQVEENRKNGDHTYITNNFG